MFDKYGREIDYIRISVTDRCNLKCLYCMPEEGVSMVSHEEILSYDEIVTLAEVFASLGIRKIKLTGGEPLVRRDLPWLVKKLKVLPGIEKVTLTTNGLFLKEALGELGEAGIDGINLSLDTLNPEVFAEITRRRGLDKVLEGFYEALKYPEIPLKINCVPLGREDQEVLEIAELARHYPVHVRYIEMMPIGLGRQFRSVGEEELLKQLREKYGTPSPCQEKLGNGPAHYYSFPGFLGKIGFISALSHKFCGSCNRVRLTSQGFLKTCLQYETGADLRRLLREGASQETLKRAVEQAIRDKPQSHRFGQKDTGEVETHMMSQIGG